MAEILIELPTEIYEQLQKDAAASGISPEKLAGEWLISRLITDEQRRAKKASFRQILAEVGLLSELGPELQKLADSSTATLEEVQEWLTPGKSLSEIVIEQREQNF